MTLPLPCGHNPMPLEHLRAGTEHWCPYCRGWYGPGMPPTLGSHLASAHHVATVRGTGEAEHLHRLLHDTTLIRLDHDHEGASL